MKNFSKAFIAALGLSFKQNIFDSSNPANPTLSPLVSTGNNQTLYSKAEIQTDTHYDMSGRSLLQEVNTTENTTSSLNITKNDLSAECLNVIDGFDNLNKAEKEIITNVTMDMVNNKFADSDIKAVYDYLAYSYNDRDLKEKAATRIFSRTGIPISDASDILDKIHTSKGSNSADLITDCVNSKFRDDRQNSSDKVLFAFIYVISGFVAASVVTSICCGIIQCIRDRRIVPVAYVPEPSTQVAYNNLEDSSASNVSVIGASPSPSESEIRTTSSPSASPKSGKRESLNRKSVEIEMV